MKQDLTRWNRAGRSTFRYIDGNAATYLEDLRQALNTRFPLWQALDIDVDPDETETQRIKRLEQQYQQVLREWGWEIARSFTRACHVLTEHADAYANEGYLGTATQWDNVRRLVEMIGYLPAPPASAATCLVLLAKEDAQGKVATGFQVQYSPEDGGPVLFETLEDIEIATALNGLRLSGWDKNTAGFSAAGGSLWQLSKDQTASVGDLAILLNTNTEQAIAVAISAVSEQGVLTLQAESAGDSWDSWAQGDAELLFDQDRIYKPYLKGALVVSVAGGHGLHQNDLVAWKDTGDHWQYNKVTAADSKGLKMNGTQPQSGAKIYKAQMVEAESGSSKLLFPSDDDYRSITTRMTGEAYWPSGVNITKKSKSSTTYGFAASYSMVDASEVGRVYFVGTDVEAVTEVKVSTPADEWIFPGGPGALKSGDWVIGEDSSGDHFELQIKEISEREDEFTLKFETTPGELSRLYGPFKETLQPQGYDENTSALSSTLSIDLAGGASLSSLLVVGKTVLLDQLDDEGETVAAHKARIKTVNHDAGTLTLDSLPAIGEGYTKGNTVLRGNVVQAGHGESKPDKVLGSGDATKSFQSFAFKETGVAFVADATQASGVRAAIGLTVAGQRWQQVATLSDAEQSDAHYTVKMTEEGGLKIGFGDGEHGRRLPTGTNNIRISYRKGTGLSGNVAAGSLLKPVKPHAKVDKVRQPLAATGGNDMEDLSALRDNAPGALFTLQRAVSLTDYARLAERHSSVWQARAFVLPHQGAQQDQLEVVVVPAGGGALGGLVTTLENYLEQYGLPGVAVSIVNHVPVAFDLDVTIRVDSNKYEPAQIVSAVRSALLGAFSLRKRRLGQPLYRSEVYAVVEGVSGVENSKALIGDSAMTGISPAPRILKGAGGTIRLIQPSTRQLLLLDSSLSNISVTAEEFEL